MTQFRIITKEDILRLEDFESNRAEMRKAIIEIKKKRRIHVGPDVTFYFENKQTLLWQIQEMLFIEKGGDAQLEDELAAYNPLVPQGNELVATMMIEIEDEDRRRHTLSQLGHIENHVMLKFENEILIANPTDDMERTNESGKTSSVHFLHFTFTPSQQEKFKNAQQALLEIFHPRYNFAQHIDKAIINELSKDFSNE